MAKASTVLKRARALISDPKGWTQGASARNKYGKMVDPESPKATRFCALGSVVRSSSTTDEEKSALRALYAVCPVVVAMNDFGKRSDAHANIMKVFGVAIERAKSRGD